MRSAADTMGAARHQVLPVAVVVSSVSARPRAGHFSNNDLRVIERQEPEAWRR
jgi:hypothetical protein